MIKPYHKDSTYSYVAGFFPTIELIKHRPESLIRVYLSNEAIGTAGHKKLLELIDEKKIVISQNAFDKLKEKGNDHCIAVFDKYQTSLNPELPHVVLVNPSDMGNLGNIMRSMLAFDYLDLAIITPAADRFNPKTVRSSMGAFFSIRQETFSSFEEYLSKYPRTYYPFMLQSSRPLSSIEKPCEKYALVFGNEATGLSDEFENGHAVRIEQSENVDSLNLATAAVVAMYAFKYMK